MTSSLLVTLLACATTIAAAQNVNTTGQAGSMVADTITAPPNIDVPNGVDTAAPVPPAAAITITETPGPMWAANPASISDSGNGSVANDGDAEIPVTKKPKKVTDSSRSQAGSGPPFDDSSASMMVTTGTGTLTLAGLFGLAAML